MFSVYFRHASINHTHESTTIAKKSLRRDSNPANRKDVQSKRSGCQNKVRLFCHSPRSSGLFIVPDEGVVVHEDAHDKDHHRYDRHEIPKKPRARLHASPVPLLRSATPGRVPTGGDANSRRRVKRHTGWNNRTDKRVCGVCATL